MGRKDKSLLLVVHLFGSFNCWLPEETIKTSGEGFYQSKEEREERTEKKGPKEKKKQGGNLLTQLSRGLGPNPGRRLGTGSRPQLPVQCLVSPHGGYEDGIFFLQIKQLKHESYSTNPATQPEYIFLQIGNPRAEPTKRVGLETPRWWVLGCFSVSVGKAFVLQAVLEFVEVSWLNRRGWTITTCMLAGMICPLTSMNHLCSCPALHTCTIPSLANKTFGLITCHDPKPDLALGLARCTPPDKIR